MGDQIGSKRIVAGPRLNYYRATNGFRLEDTDLGKEQDWGILMYKFGPYKPLDELLCIP